jgi:Ca-activated chloride channel family protein
MRRQALDWIESLKAGGGTEMTQAVLEALQPLRSSAQRQVVLVTDGQIGFEREVFRAIRDRLPAGSRFHAVGVGTAVNRALLAPAARAGRGVEVIIDLDETPECGVERLVAATRRPALTDVECAGPALTGQAPRRLPDVLAGAPVLASVRLRAEGGELTVRGRSAAGAWARTLAVPATGAGSGSPSVTAHYGREAVEDLELDRAVGADAAETDRIIERLGLEFCIGTRLTSWVAISDEPTVDPGQPTRRTLIPQELPYGLSAEGLGLRQPQDLKMMQTFASMPLGAARAKHLPTVALAGIGARALRSILRSRGASDKAAPPPQDSRVPPSEPPDFDVDEGSALMVPPEPLEPPHRDDALPLSAGPFTGRWAASAVPDVQVPGPGVKAPGPDIHVLEFEVTGGVLLWYAESPARLLLPGGGEVTVAVDVDGSTRAGRIEAGTVVRVALRMTPDLRDRAVAVELRAGPRIVRIQL